MAVTHVFTHADICYDNEFRDLVLDCPYSLLYYPFGAVSLRALLIFVFRDTEQDDGRYPEFMDFPGFFYYLIN